MDGAPRIARRIRAGPLRVNLKIENEEILNIDDSELPASPVETLGEVFADGTFLEPMHHPVDRGVITLMFVGRRER
jgi:hypothetical protein